MYFDRPVGLSFWGSRRSETRTAGWRAHRRGTGSVLRTAFYVAAACGDAVVVLLSALASGLAYHWAFYDPRGMSASFLLLGSAVGFFFVAPAIVRDEYAIAKFATKRSSLTAVVLHWNIAFVSAILLAFVSKTSSDISRGTMGIFYVVGLISIVRARLLFHHLAHRVAAAEGPAARRVFLVGSEKELTHFADHHLSAPHGIRLVSASVIRGKESAPDDLALAAATARMLCPDDVLILMPWSDTESIEACVDAFLRVPASIHLGPERIFEKFNDVTIDHNGGIPSLRLVRSPLRAIDIGLKRVMDVAGSGLGLLALAPLFALIALVIKLDSPGPVFFIQRRYGFNQEPFRIYKFRSMTVAEEGRAVRQVRPGDGRVTRVGTFLRRWNLDELPQLVNVLRGHMSLVGPRPHALVHDQQYERTVALYARRHNVKPGMTGWAQVNGRRGEISSGDDIRERVELDLYYIDHWTLIFDVKILALTIFSASAYRNAV
jgi:Undecaprenyl-phosphate glucose phosphotransferase